MSSPYRHNNTTKLQQLALQRRRWRFLNCLQSKAKSGGMGRAAHSRFVVTMGILPENGIHTSKRQRQAWTNNKIHHHLYCSRASGKYKDVFDFLVVTFTALLENGINIIICTTTGSGKSQQCFSVTCCGSSFCCGWVPICSIGDDLMILTSWSTLTYPADFKGNPSFHPKADN